MRHLFIGNPMLGELQREKNKALAPHNWQGSQLAARVLLVIFYLLLLLIVLVYVRDIEPYHVLYALLGLLTVLLPASLHGVIAGEREKRSLDMLLCAPLTAGQIVVGKFSRAAITMIGLVLAIGVPALIIEVVKEFYVPREVAMEGHTMGGFFYALLVCLVTAVFISSVTLWISSKTKTSSSAMLSTIATLFLFFVVAPAIGSVVRPISFAASNMLTLTNPYVTLINAYTGQTLRISMPYGSEQVATMPYTLVSIAACLLASVLFLVLATQNVYELSRGRKE
ncbi:MAG TPA: ABC transporter permease subunit [Fimbriimonadaceae bacterium]|nr:ABC transporter permease subunit [Fimbriimonadaceae bacterium]